MISEGDHKRFMLAGKSLFTLKNPQSGNRFTFRVSKKEDKELWFVSVLTGSDNTTDYSYIGTIFGSDFRLTKNSKVTEKAQSFKVFKWFWSTLSRNKSIAPVEMYHEGRCGRCGRLLTVPESVKSGFGPECITKI